MSKKKIAPSSIIGAIMPFFIMPTTVGAVTQSDALARLKEYYDLLIRLATKGLEGYIEYLKVL